MPSLHGFLVDVLRLTIWLALLAAVFVPVERLFARVGGGRTRSETGRDVALYFLNSLVPALLMAAPLAVIANLAHRLLPDAYLGWVNGQPLWAQLLATFVAGEIGFYWGHRWQHRWPLLWQFHVVHHRPSRLDWLMNTHAHPIDILFARLSGLAPIYLLGLAGHGADEGNLPAILFTIAGVTWGFFIHADVRWRLGWLGHAIATPHFHHWHHTRSGPIDRNFASTLPVLDRLFGTLHAPRAWPEDYGVRAPEPGGRPSAAPRATAPESGSR